MKLKAAHFEHDDVVRSDPRQISEQALPDVAPQPTAPTGGGDHLGEHGRGRRFAGGTGHPDYCRRAGVQKQFRFRSDLRAVAPRLFDKRILRPYCGIDDDHISRLKIVLMMPAKGESCDWHIGKLGDRFSQRLLIR